MKQLYPVLFFFFISFSYGQEVQNAGGEIAGFELYPNPVTTGKVYIQTALNAPKRILIFDVFGTKRLETTILRKELNVSNLVAGVYVLRVYEKDKMATRKLIIR